MLSETLDRIETRELGERGARPSLGREVLRHLRQFILANRLGPGDRLPTERQLANELGVSRTSVRAALGLLESIGAVDRAPKRGTVLQNVDFAVVAELAQFLLLRSHSDLAELYQARRLFEIGILPDVLERWDEERAAKARKALRQMEHDLTSGSSAWAAELEFHRVMVEATQNAFITQYSALLFEYFDSPLVHPPTSQEVAEADLAAHRSLLAAIERCDLEEARTLLSSYFDRSSPPSQVAPLGR